MAVQERPPESQGEYAKMVSGFLSRERQQQSHGSKANQSRRWERCQAATMAHHMVQRDKAAIMPTPNREARNPSLFGCSTRHYGSHQSEGDLIISQCHRGAEFSNQVG